MHRVLLYEPLKASQEHQDIQDIDLLLLIHHTLFHCQAYRLETLTRATPKYTTSPRQRPCYVPS